MKLLLFFIVILLANVIQGITGFAGTILAMPPGLMLVGYAVAKPILNFLGLLSGIYVFVQQYSKVCWAQVWRIVLIMAVGIVTGVGVKGCLTGQEILLYRLLGVFIICLSLAGLYGSVCKQRNNKALADEGTLRLQRGGDFLMLLLAGVVHGIFVSGGPLVIGYLTRRIRDKEQFRATISTVWIILNSMIFIDDFRSGLWGASLVKVQLISIPFFLAGMFAGSVLYRKMSQRLFMFVTYVLLLISGISLLFK